ncbi:MAG TPA: serine hydrolase [Propionibacteriaceae bacterium]|nr:serine hydrolase [Propionibacteriaceae bacterium]
MPSEPASMTLLPRTTPEKAGVDPRAVIDLLDAWASQSFELHSLVLVRRGQVFASAAAGPWTLTHPALVYSMSKTFTSAAVGLAVADGAFGYDDPIVDHFGDLVDERVGPKSRTIRVRDCLAMATGHTTDAIEWLPPIRLSRASIGEFLRREPEGTPGETFCYNQLATYTAATLVHETTGRTVAELIHERVLSRLGIPDLHWSPDVEGRPLGFSGFHIDPESLAAWIWLLTNDGVHNGEQLLPREWLDGYRTKQVDNASVESNHDWTLGYGWQVWMSSSGHRADGAMGQYGLMLPERELAVIITGSVDDMQPPLTAVWDHLLPGVDRAPEPGARAELDARLAELCVPPVGGDILPGAAWAGIDASGSSMTLTPDGDGWELTWFESDGASNRFAIGHGAWARTTVHWPEGTHLDVATSGGWVDGDTFVARIACLDTPHTAILTLGSTASLAWALPPLGPVTLRQLAVPDEA